MGYESDAVKNLTDLAETTKHKGTTAETAATVANALATLALVEEMRNCHEVLRDIALNVSGGN